MAFICHSRKQFQAGDSLGLVGRRPFQLPVVFEQVIKVGVVPCGRLHRPLAFETTGEGVFGVTESTRASITARPWPWRIWSIIRAGPGAGRAGAVKLSCRGGGGVVGGEYLKKLVKG